MPPPQPFVFPFDEASALQAAMSDLKAALDGLVLSHLLRVDEVRQGAPGGGGPSEIQPVFSGAAREAFDSLFDPALDAVAGLAVALGTDGDDLATTVEHAYTAAAERSQEIQQYEESAPPPRPHRDPEAPLGG